MPIAGAAQPAYIELDAGLRLRAFAWDAKLLARALSWYQDPEIVWLVDGKRTPYTPERLHDMYAYLARQGELYFIETRGADGFFPIGDVTFWQEDMPIVIGDAAYRGRGVGTKTVGALVERGRALGYPALFVREIYRWNTASRRCFEKAGFRPCAQTEHGDRYRLELRRPAEPAPSGTDRAPCGR